tara:strand:- start:50 stop:247 length:198 start_codon:yes stop_codon:yes gene_type:complete
MYRVKMEIYLDIDEKGKELIDEVNDFIDRTNAEFSYHNIVIDEPWVRPLRENEGKPYEEYELLKG